MMRSFFLVLATSFALSLPAQEPSKPTWTAMAAYPLTTCVVSGKPLDAAKMKRFDAGGREFRTCCGGCQGKIQKDPAAWTAKLDEAVKANDGKLYPLETCAVCTSGKLADGAKDVVLDGFLVRCCGAACAEKATATKAAVLAKVQAAAIARQKAAYPLKTCAVTGDELDAKNLTTMLVGYQLVQLCCEDCIDTMKNEPAKAQAVLGKLQPAAAKTAEKGECCSEGEGKKGECCSEGEGKKECCSEKAETTKPEAKTNGKSAEAPARK
jgi:hypothetical protein